MVVVNDQILAHSLSLFQILKNSVAQDSPIFKMSIVKCNLVQSKSKMEKFVIAKMNCEGWNMISHCFERNKNGIK